MLQTIARLLGWTPPAAATAPHQLPASPPPGLLVRRDGELGMPPPVFDLDLLRGRNLALGVAAAMPD